MSTKPIILIALLIAPLAVYSQSKRTPMDPRNYLGKPMSQLKPIGGLKDQNMHRDKLKFVGFAMGTLSNRTRIDVQFRGDANKNVVGATLQDSAFPVKSIADVKKHAPAFLKKHGMWSATVKIVDLPDGAGVGVTGMARVPKEYTVSLANWSDGLAVLFEKQVPARVSAPPAIPNAGTLAALATASDVEWERAFGKPFWKSQPSKKELAKPGDRQTRVVDEWNASYMPDAYGQINVSFRQEVGKTSVPIKISYIAGPKATVTQTTKHLGFPESFFQTYKSIAASRLPDTIAYGQESESVDGRLQLSFYSYKDEKEGTLLELVNIAERGYQSVGR